MSNGKFLAADDGSDYTDLAGLHWKHISSINSRDAKFHHLYSKAISTHDKKVKLQLTNHISDMILIDEVFSVFLDLSTQMIHSCVNKDDQGECIDAFVPTDFDCLRSMVSVYESSCG